MQSHHLALPFIQPAQAQKHVTHNESLLTLDAIVHLCVEARSIMTPPDTPEDGDRYLVPENAMGIWQGRANTIAIWTDQQWHFHAPNTVWLCYVREEDALVVLTKGVWSPIITQSASEQLPQLGIGTSADEINRLSVRSPALLLSHDVDDARMVINKAASDNTASLIFQSGFTGHAEIGLSASNDLTLNISNSGESWTTALRLNSENGHIEYGLDQKTDRWLFSDTNTSLGISSFGSGALINSSGTSGFFNTAIGSHSLFSNTTGQANTAIGYFSGRANTSGSRNTAAGYVAMQNNTSGGRNCALGFAALQSNTSGSSNTSIGHSAMRLGQNGVNNSAVGDLSLELNQTGSYNTAIGARSLRFTQDGSTQTNLNNCTGIGFDARVSGSNQIQLGNTQTTTYAYGAIQNRSDARDKADIRPTKLGLDFVLGLNPVDYRLDMRDDYLTPMAPGNSGEQAVAPQPQKDGSKKRKRFHHGFLAQEVEALSRDMGHSFGGYQDHSLAPNGTDVLTLGYTEFIAPIVRAIQEQSALIQHLEEQIKSLQKP